MKIMEITDELEKDKETVTTSTASKKPLIEVVETTDKKNPIEELENKTVEHEYKPQTGITREGNLIINHEKKVAFKIPVEENNKEAHDIKSDNKDVPNTIPDTRDKKPLKKILINEINSPESKTVLITEIPMKTENKEKGKVSEKDNAKDKDKNKEDKGNKDERKNDDKGNTSTSSGSEAVRRRSGEYT